MISNSSRSLSSAFKSLSVDTELITFSYSSLKSIGKSFQCFSEYATIFFSPGWVWSLIANKISK